MDEITVKNVFVNLGDCHKCDAPIAFNKKDHPDTYETYSQKNLYCCPKCGQGYEFIWQVGKVPPNKNMAEGSHRRH